MECNARFDGRVFSVIYVVIYTLLAFSGYMTLDILKMISLDTNVNITLAFIQNITMHIATIIEFTSLDNVHIILLS